MTILNLAAILVTLAAVFGYINYRYIRLPNTIGLMLIALLMSLTLILMGFFGLTGIESYAQQILSSIDFNTTLMHGMLSFLLFAGALHINLEDLASQKWVVAILATFGVVASTFLVGTAAWYVLGWLGIPLPYIYCLLFGALISPTDPIAVMGILKTAGAPKTLEIKIAGESLFNDGVAVVIFLVLLSIATSHTEISAGSIALLFVEEAIGGIVYGLVIGYITYCMLKNVNNYQIEVLLTLALVMGGYALATAIHVSAPLAMVVAGLLIGNQGRQFAMSEYTREHLDTFWELVDEILNAVLFVLIGLELLVLTFIEDHLFASLLMIPIVVIARLISVGLPIGLMRFRRAFSPGVVKILTWGGLRGGISVALALSLPAGSERELILSLTYVVVIFSITVQGLTIGRLVRASAA
ncbi:MAG: sodium:proton antiporter [Gammaproteobacteria bacterium]|nr:sodium:proton antiporter [Gammaproteobacteria bacterium]